MGDGPGTYVDIGGLRDFAGQVRGRADGSLIEGSGQVYNPFGKGVVFGHGMDVSPVVRQARQRGHQTLDTGYTAYTGFINEAKWLAATAERMARTYGDADWSSAATAEQIKGLFDEGRAAAAGGGQPRADAGGGPDAAGRA